MDKQPEQPSSFSAELLELFEKYKDAFSMIEARASELPKDMISDLRSILIPSVDKAGSKLSKSICLSEKTFNKFIRVKSEYTVEFSNPQEIISGSSLLTPFKSSTASFRVPVHEIINEGKSLSEIKLYEYFDDLDDNIFLLDDFIVNRNYKFDLDSLINYISVVFQEMNDSSLAIANPEIENSQHLLNYSILVTYEDTKGYLHVVFAASISQTENLQAWLDNHPDITIDPFQANKVITQTLEALAFIMNELKLFEKSKNVDVAFLPTFSSISLQGIWKLSSDDFRISLFAPYFSDPSSKEAENQAANENKNLFSKAANNFGRNCIRFLLPHNEEKRILQGCPKDQKPQEYLLQYLEKNTTGDDSLFKDEYAVLKDNILRLVKFDTQPKVFQLDYDAKPFHYLLLSRFKKEDINYKNEIKAHFKSNPPKDFLEGTDPFEHLSV